VSKSIESQEVSNPKEERTNAFWLGGIAVVLLGVAVYMHFFANREEDYPTYPGAVYYTGPMKAKTGVGYGTIDGQPITDEEAKAQAKRWLEEYKAKNPKRG